MPKLQAFDKDSINYAKSRSKKDLEMDQIVQYLIREFGGYEVPTTREEYDNIFLRSL